MRRVFMTGKGDIRIVDFGDSEESNELKPRRVHDIERLRKLAEFIKCKLAIQAEIAPELVAEYNELAKRYPNE